MTIAKREPSSVLPDEDPDGPDETTRWDPIVEGLLQILGDLVLLGAASTGAGEVSGRIQEAAIQVARAAALALPLSRYGGTGSERALP